MRKTWSNGYVSVQIEVKPLVSMPQEEGFISPELYAMLDASEKSALQASYSNYEKMAASLAKAQKDQFNPGSTLSFNDISRNFDNRDNAARGVEAMVAQYAQKYGMGVVTEEPEEATKGTR
ncbi:MAG: hypothetical protein J6Y42_01170 [Bacilli bacterium]|nr:hypothetical protein [Bacilli bacterium]